MKEGEKVAGTLLLYRTTVNTKIWTVKVLPWFKDEALVAGAAGDVFAVEVLQQWDGVFAGDAREIFECGDVDQALGFVL